MLTSKTKTKTSLAWRSYRVVSLRRVLILSLATFGFYQLYWFYKNWVVYSERTGKKIWALVRALFASLICYPLFDDVLESAKRQQFNNPFPVIALAIVFLVLDTMNAAGGLVGAVAVALSPLPLLYIQEAINYEAAAIDPQNVPVERFKAWQVILIICGLILFVLYFIKLLI